MTPFVLAQAEAATDWPSAAIAIAGITFVTIVAAVALWQVFSTARAQMSIAREKAYKELAERTALVQQELAADVKKTAADIAQLKSSVHELERLLKEVQ